MKREFDLSGTLMNKDVALARFAIERGSPSQFEQLCFDPALFPFEMAVLQNGNTLVHTFLERVVPASRQGLLEDLAKFGLHEYDLSAILRLQNGSSVEDSFWVRFENEGPQTWRELRLRIGYTET